MIEFQKKRIRKSKLQKMLTPQLMAFGLGFLIFFLLAVGVIKIIKNIELGKVLFLFGKDLEEDSYGHTNILLLGTGGDLHEGGDLTDTIIVATIDQEKKQVRLLSIPRDLYVNEKKLEGTFINGGMRINDVYFLAKKQFGSSELALELMQKKIEEVLGLEIQYYAKVEFKIFVDIINALEGIDMYIPEAINDPMYPKGETGFYETFFIPQGFQHLDGEIALKYARSRHTTSDFSRSQRQQDLLYAIKEKAKKMNLFSSTSELENIYDSMKDNIETNISLREIIRLGEMASDIAQKDIENYLIHDDPSKCGGFLYTPDRELYGGAFVFVPAGKGFEPLHKMANIVLHNGHINNAKLQILNGTRKIFLAGRTKSILNRHCFNVIRYGNAENLEKMTTTYYIKKPSPEISTVVSLLQQFVPGDINDQTPFEYLSPPYASDADIILVLGNDYLRYEMKDPFDAIVELQKPARKVEDEPSVSQTLIPNP